MYVSEKHSLWKKGEGGKVSKRYGRLMKSEGDVVNGMMVRYREPVTMWMDAMIRKRRDRRRAEFGKSDDEDEEEGKADVTRVMEKESDGDTIDDPAVVAEGAGGFGIARGPSAGVVEESVITVLAAPTAAPLPPRGDVVMTTEQ